jgi:hypothetical protein
MNKLLIIILAGIFIAPVLHGKDFKGGEYRTKESFLYGRFETRLKTPQREGVLASFFTYYDGGGGVGNWNEIDIEVLGRYTNDVQVNTITPGQTNHVRHQPVNFNPHLDFHIYAFEWTPDYVAWFIDGVEFYRQTEDHIQTLNKSQKLMMNIWNPAYENWVGQWDENILPAFAYYDWVKYYSYTPDSGNYGTGNNFSHQWTDDFDSWDQSRWDKATHTFGGNNCDFIHDNVVFKDGNMILCLTNNINLGYVDIKAPVLKWARASAEKIIVMFSEELDQNSAENISNYILPGKVINTATLLPDQKSAELSISDLDLNANYNLIVGGIKDRAAVPNTMALKSVIVSMPSPLEFPVKINTGGSAVLDFLGDQEFNHLVEYGFLDGGSSQYPTSLQINGTDEDVIYRMERYGSTKYYVRLPNGNYNLKLMFVENYFNQSGLRIFDIYIQEEKRINNLDIFQSVGLNTALEITLTDIPVADELLEISFAAHVQNPLLNGIVIEGPLVGIKDTKKNENFLADFSLEQNYPNPFNGTTKINYSINAKDNLIFEVYDLLGNKIYTHDLGVKEAGTYQLSWLAVNEESIPLSSGVYFYSLKGKENILFKKLVLLN